MAKKKSSSPRSSAIAASPTVPDWQRTYLWKTLENRARKHGNIHAHEMLPVLTTWMGQLHTVLKSGGTGPADFTLHNDEHAFRVAERIARLFTDSVRRNISDYELALLLLAAYGHDIGMTPQRQLVARHHRHLFHPEASELTTGQQQQFQEFIDNFPARAVTLPLTGSIDDLNLADELTTYYVRDRHNDWSADWLREHLQGQLAYLPDTVTVLVRLCQSHHWGFDRLARSDFDPLLSTGPQPQLIHLRYLACLLRLADILENDPERTPDVIFRHRSIQDRPRSLVHWIKDHHFTIDEQGDRLVLNAIPPDARTHHAIEQLADWIDHELQGIAAIGERLPVEYQVGRDTIRRDWHLAPGLTRRIQPQPGTYRYINGAFRPNTQRLLQLLSNEQLYGKPIVAVRELLQNAFDAVREKIARKRLEPHLPDKADRKWETELGNQEKVTLTLRRLTDTVGGKAQVRHLLLCDDTGVGLTDKLITGHLLVSGQSRRHDILELERRCQDAGFPLGRTGQFGIGVLSYFMLAKEVRLTTTRYQGCGDADQPSWHFHTHGLSDFGELRPAATTPFPTGGTRVEWVLRPEQLGDEQAFPGELLKYLRETLIRIPCQFEFKVEGYDTAQPGWQRMTGWTRTLEEWKEIILGQWEKPEVVFDDKEFLLSPEKSSRQQAERAAYATALAQATAALKLAETEVPLPNSLGWSRLILPYFDLPRGRSLFFPIVDEQGFTLIENIDGLPAPVSSRTSWKGIACLSQQPPPPEESDQELQSVSLQPPAFASETDILQVDRQTLEVSRASVVLSNTVVNAASETVITTAHDFADGVLGPSGANFFGELNLIFQLRELTLHRGAGVFVNEGRIALRPLVYPLTLEIERHSQSKLATASDEKKVQQLRRIVQMRSTDQWDLILPPADRVCLVSYPGASLHNPELICCWDLQPSGEAVFKQTKFPAEWRDLAMVYDDARCVAIQPQHPLLALLDANTLHGLVGVSLYQLQPNWEAIAALATPAEAALMLPVLAAWMLHTSYSDEWQQLDANKPDFLANLWQSLATATGKPLTELAFIATNGIQVVKLSPEGLVRWGAYSGTPCPLPEVTDPEFILVKVEA